MSQDLWWQSIVQMTSRLIKYWWFLGTNMSMNVFNQNSMTFAFCHFTLHFRHKRNSTTTRMYWLTIKWQKSTYFKSNVYKVLQRLYVSKYTVSTKKVCSLYFGYNFLKSWPNLKSKVSFEICLFSAIQNCPYFWNLAK